MMNPRLIKISNGNQQAWLYPEHGFQLYGYQIPLAGKTLKIIHVPNEDREPSDRRYGNPILFPAPSLSISSAGKDSWILNNKPHTMPPHGIARNTYWHVLDIQPHSVLAEMVPHTGTAQSFPFQFKLRMKYQLDSRGLVLDAEVENEDKVEFPYALGFHPYLLTPPGMEGSKSDFSIALPKATRIFSEDGWLSMQKEPNFGPLQVSATDGEPLNKTIMLADSGAKFLELVDSKGKISMRVSVEGSEQSLPIWAVWSLSPESPYVCLEPWSDYPNALNRGGTRTCKPGEIHRYQMVISCKAS